METQGGRCHLFVEDKIATRSQGTGKGIGKRGHSGRGEKKIGAFRHPNFGVLRKGSVKVRKQRDGLKNGGPSGEKNIAKYTEEEKGGGRS